MTKFSVICCNPRSVSVSAVRVVAVVVIVVKLI